MNAIDSAALPGGALMIGKHFIDDASGLSCFRGVGVYLGGKRNQALPQRFTRPNTLLNTGGRNVTAKIQRHEGLQNAIISSWLRGYLIDKLHN